LPTFSVASRPTGKRNDSPLPALILMWKEKFDFFPYLGKRRTGSEMGPKTIYMGSTTPKLHSIQVCSSSGGRREQASGKEKTEISNWKGEKRKIELQ